AQIGTITDKNGVFSIKVPANQELNIIISFIGYKTKGRVATLIENEQFLLNETLEKSENVLPPVEIIDNKTERLTNIVKIDPKLIDLIPGAMTGVEALLKTLPGVSSNNELSSQYSVRGGNYDENLVYVNDIEIYRPFLIRSGQQEGLSFANPDLVSSIQFSSGGFDAKYGDKMSSVLDIKYKKPTELAGSASVSLLGGSAHVEGCSDNHRFTYISGIRYKSTQYLLNSLQTKGDYKPSFIDFQAFFTYDLNEKLELNILGNFAQNHFLFVPDELKTAFGNINEALGLSVYFEGQELDRFTTMNSAVSLNYRVKENTMLKFIASGYQSIEEEAYDILGQYYLNELDKELGSDNLGDSLMNIGLGSYIDHARNNLQASVLSFSHIGTIEKNNHNIQWGAKYQYESIIDEIKEWKMLDSAGYSIPYTDSIVSVSDYLKSSIDLQSSRISSFLQNTYSVTNDSIKYFFTGGIRANYWTYSNQLLISPRVSCSIKPNWKRDYVFRFAWGYYYQPPFYRELRDKNGELNPDIKAQTSIHYVVGSDYAFNAWNRPFKFITELYFKKLKNLIPYDVDNVRIRYYATNNSKGYVAGIDLKVNGEFVRGVDSWASLSIMQTEENIEGDYATITQDSISYSYERGYIARPTDQRVNFSMFFQDYLPGNPSYKMQLSLFFGSRLPFGPPNSEEYRSAFRMPAYRRVDIGFSKVIKSDEFKSKSKFLNHFESLWLTAEIFNLLGTNNTISYMWISDIYNRQYAVPNYLTARRINVKLIAKF
ncbi:MAG: hypothetical protein A2265_05960, partial [Bacteroidetes bacterium RIFOXYA12_FULL_33_9]